ncbi:MAG: site-specific integrase, partial [Actinobacteria bacterium]|nr:site-specific integrase [Actinomycetota bacterium]
MAEAGSRYITHKQAVGLKRSTLQDYESYLRVHLAPFFGERPLDSIDLELVEEFIAAKRQQGKATKSAINYVLLLSAIFGHAIRRGWCTRNPVRDVEKPRDDRSRDIRFLSGAELEALLAAVRQTTLGRSDRVLYLAAAMTGMRRGELLALRWQDIDWQSLQIRVRRNYTRGEFGTPKSRRSTRTVPLAPRLVSELKDHLERSRFSEAIDLVFCNPASGAVRDGSHIRRRFIATAGRAGLRPVRFHDLRHTFGTQMAAAGAPMRAVQEWMGHSNYQTTSIYADYALDPARGAHYATLAFPPPTEPADSTPAA